MSECSRPRSQQQDLRSAAFAAPLHKKPHYAATGQSSVTAYASDTEPGGKSRVNESGAELPVEAVGVAGRTTPSRPEQLVPEFLESTTGAIAAAAEATAALTDFTATGRDCAEDAGISADENTRSSDDEVGGLGTSGTTAL